MVCPTSSIEFSENNFPQRFIHVHPFHTEFSIQTFPSSHSHWIRLFGNIYTGNPWVFTMKKNRIFPVPIFPNKPAQFSIDLSSSGGAGVFAGYSDEAYEQKGCTVTSRGDTIDKSEALGADGGWRMTIRPLKGGLDICNE